MTYDDLLEYLYALRSDAQVKAFNSAYTAVFAAIHDPKVPQAAVIQKIPGLQKLFFAIDGVDKNNALFYQYLCDGALGAKPIDKNISWEKCFISALTAKKFEKIVLNPSSNFDEDAPSTFSK